MKLNEKQKIIFTILVITVFLGALGALNYFKYKDRSELLAKIDNLKQEEKKYNDKIAKIPELRKIRKDLANTIEQYTGILPQEEHVEHDAFAEIIDGYSRETQVVIQEVEYLKPKDRSKDKNAAGKTADQNFLRHRYRLNLAGTFPDFLRFIGKIENHTRFLKIDEINIKPFGAPDVTNEMDDKHDPTTLERAKVPIKEIELVLSTYTYKKESPEAEAKEGQKGDAKGKPARKAKVKRR